MLNVLLKKIKMNKIYLIMALLLLPIVTAVECEISSDNITYSKIDNTLYGGCIDENNNIAHVQNIDVEQNYYFRCRENSSEAWIYKATKSEEGVNMEQIFNLMVFGGYLFLQLVLIVFIHIFKNDTGSGIVYGTLATIFSVIMLAIFLGGFNVLKDVIFIIDVNYYLMLVTAGIGVYTFLLANNIHKELKANQTE